MRRWLLACAVAAAVAAQSFRADQPVHYRFSFPEPAQQWMQVEATFPDLDAAPLELTMSRSSPGRYSEHDFARNVYDVGAFAPDGRELQTVRAGPAGWIVPKADGTVTVKYKVYGDRLDGTYLAIDGTHAHINMPAAVMWARGPDDRAATLAFAPPPGSGWQIATQLHPSSSGPASGPAAPAAAFDFMAPNLQYLMDSPVELGPLMIETFEVGPRTFRFAAHHTGTRMDVQAFVKDVGRILEQQAAVFGEFPSFEPGAYTFIADLLPYAATDAMEHRNSTVITSPGAIANSRIELLESASHEFFHAWNVERIRPRSLEPFDLDRANPSAELWLAEGFTQYYGPLVVHRAGLVDLRAMCRTLTDVLNAARVGAGRLVRSAEEISRMAASIERPDGTATVDVVSYYYLGASIALALDLSLRARSNGTVTLDEFMRRLWREHGRPGGARPGYVDRPYTMADVEAALATVSSRAFARDFFARYIQGREFADYQRLLAPAGLLMRRVAGGRVEVVPFEAAGRSLNAAHRAFREEWLGSK